MPKQSSRGFDCGPDKSSEPPSTGRAKVRCPRCGGVGQIEVGHNSAVYGYYVVQETCPVCLGAKRITESENAAYFRRSPKEKDASRLRLEEELELAKQRDKLDETTIPYLSMLLPVGIGCLVGWLYGWQSGIWAGVISLICLSFLVGWSYDWQDAFWVGVVGLVCLGFLIGWAYGWQAAVWTEVLIIALVVAIKWVFS